MTTLEKLNNEIEEAKQQGLEKFELDQAKFGNRWIEEIKRLGYDECMQILNREYKRAKDFVDLLYPRCQKDLHIVYYNLQDFRYLIVNQKKLVYLEKQIAFIEANK